LLYLLSILSAVLRWIRFILRITVSKRPELKF
jgi:hypothetical protein